MSAFFVFFCYIYNYYYYNMRHSETTRRSQIEDMVVATAELVQNLFCRFLLFRLSFVLLFFYYYSYSRRILFFICFFFFHTNYAPQLGSSPPDRMRVYWKYRERVRGGLCRSAALIGLQRAVTALPGTLTRSFLCVCARAH